MLQNADFLAKIGVDTAENEQHFAEILPICRRVAGAAGRQDLLEGGAGALRTGNRSWLDLGGRCTLQMQIAQSTFQSTFHLPKVLSKCIFRKARRKKFFISAAG